MKAVYMRARAGEKGFDPKKAYEYADDIGVLLQPIDDEVERKRSAWLSANGTKAASGDPERRGPRKAEVQYVSIKGGTAENVGFVYGEIVEATRADDLRAGDIAAVSSTTKVYTIVGRVVAADGERLTVRDENEEVTFARPEIEFAGRVKTEAVGRWDGPTEAEQKQIKEARAKLKELGNEDYQIIRCTERYKLEKIIFDIEHPAGGDPDDWSEWLEEEGGDE